ncbi:uncharacterized protein LOC117900329 [Drosophila subobscura]|uniref:uncharacterized protein LOC117900329 n=1 Tax=Drosophila subobscura TaxID=7241 RepID=UPI00155A34CC|nr:uncharacterized protein LOC117900329 [Drosophila subobscura]
MHQLRQFNNDFMRYLVNLLTFDARNKNPYSIWKICPRQQLDQAHGKLQFCEFCKPALFPFIFWLVLALSIWGFACTLKQTLKLLRCPNSKLGMWRQREFHVFGAKVLHYARLLGSCAIITSWCMLIVGLVMLKPRLMSPWIVINSVVLGGEFIVWVYDVMTGHTQLELHTGLTLMLPFLNLMMVRCVKVVMEHSLKNHVEDSLRIF